MYNKRHEFWQVSEGRIIAALRDEVTAAEVRLEEERAAHTTTQRTAAAREQVPLLPFSPPPLSPPTLASFAGPCQHLVKPTYACLIG